MANTNLRQIFLCIVLISLVVILPRFLWAQQNSNLIPAGKWIDRDIYSKSGDEIGEIDDLVIKRNGKIKLVTIDVGGFLGIGDKLVALTPNEFEALMVKSNGKMVLDTTEAKMEKRQQFDYYRQGLRPDYYYRPRYYRMYGYYGYPPPPYSQYGPYGPQPSERPAAPYPEREPYDWVFSPGRYLASAVMGRRVINESGHHLGRVSDLLIDTRDVMVKKVILTAEDIRGEVSQVAVSYQPPGFTAYGMVFDISQEEIKNMPGYHHEN